MLFPSKVSYDPNRELPRVILHQEMVMRNMEDEDPDNCGWICYHRRSSGICSEKLASMSI
jgi:hypothetical protein